MLSEKQIQAIELLIEGKKKTEIAKELKIGRTTLYHWFDNSEFTAEWHRREQQLCDETLNAMKSDVKVLLEQVKTIALTSENEGMRLQACRELLDRILGKATAKQEIAIDKATESDINLDDIDTLLDEDNSLDNVIELDKAK